MPSLAEPADALRKQLFLAKGTAYRTSALSRARHVLPVRQGHRTSRMKLSGSVLENLQAAVRSARRFRGHPVHSETVQFWRDLLSYARQVKAEQPSHEEQRIDDALVQLETELSDRG